MKSRDKKTGWLRKIKKHPLWRLETGLFAGAVLAGALSAALSHANHVAATEKFTMKVVPIVVAAKDLMAGDVISENSLQRGELLRSRATNNIAKLNQASKLVGKRIKIGCKAGDPILLTAVYGASGDKRMADVIPAGKRLFSLTISDRVASHGWVKPNDRVDIMAHMELPGRGLTSMVLLEGVTLVTVDDTTVWNDGSPVNGSEIGFFADPQDIPFLSFAQKRGSFSISLRNPADIAKSRKDPTSLEGVDINSFQGHEMMEYSTGGGELKVIVDSNLEKSVDENEKKKQ